MISKINVNSINVQATLNEMVSHLRVVENQSIPSVVINTMKTCNIFQVIPLM